MSSSLFQKHTLATSSSPLGIRATASRLYVLIGRDWAVLTIPVSGSTAKYFLSEPWEIGRWQSCKGGYNAIKGRALITLRCHLLSFKLYTGCSLGEVLVAVTWTTTVFMGVFSTTSDEYCCFSNWTVGFPDGVVIVGHVTKKEERHAYYFPLILTKSTCFKLRKLISPSDLLSKIRRELYCCS